MEACHTLVLPHADLEDEDVHQLRAREDYAREALNQHRQLEGGCTTRLASSAPAVCKLVTEQADLHACGCLNAQEPLQNFITGVGICTQTPIVVQS